MPSSDAASGPTPRPSRDLPVDIQATRDPRTALVTGATGFGGSHLVRALLGTAWSIVGLTRDQPAVERPDPRYRLVVADLTEAAALRAVVREAAPDYVFHLAAATPPAPDQRCFEVNVGGATAFLEALAQECPAARVVVVGSDAQYGPLDPAYLPTSERTPMRPLGAYGRSKVLQEAVALRYGAMTDLGVVCLRPFNYIGPGQSANFVISRIARQVALAEAGAGPPTVELGNVVALRDFTDVRDMVRAFVLAAVLGRSGTVYNVGSGTPHSIAEVAGRLTALATTPVAVRSVPDRLRRNDVPVTTCDASLLRSHTAWSPRIPLPTTLADTLEHWRRAVASGEEGPDPFPRARSAS